MLEYGHTKGYGTDDPFYYAVVILVGTSGGRRHIASYSNEDKPDHGKFGPCYKAAKSHAKEEAKFLGCKAVAMKVGS